MSDDLVFLFDNIDPNKGPRPNLIPEPKASRGFFNPHESLLKKTFSNFNVKFRSSYFCDEESKWLYPVYLNHLLFFNSLIQIKSMLPKKVESNLHNGKIIVFVYEPFNSFDDFKIFENIAHQQTPEIIYCVKHPSLVPNIIMYDSCILERDVKFLNETESYKMEFLEDRPQKVFSAFLHHYEECTSRMQFLHFLEKTGIIDQIYISAAEQGGRFSKINKIHKTQHIFGNSDISFSSFDKTFELLNIEETLKKSLIHIAFEGDMASNVNRDIITEKVYRCVEAKMPFILASHPYSLNFFRSLGFKSFSPLINEDYDQEESPPERLKMIFKEINRLANIPFDHLKKQIQELEPIFEHNFNVLRDNHNNTQNNIYRLLYGTQ
jgi:hypothetical protein